MLWIGDCSLYLLLQKVLAKYKKNSITFLCQKFILSSYCAQTMLWLIVFQYQNNTIGIPLPQIVQSLSTSTTSIHVLSIRTLLFNEPHFCNNWYKMLYHIGLHVGQHDNAYCQTYGAIWQTPRIARNNLKLTASVINDSKKFPIISLSKSSSTEHLMEMAIVMSYSKWGATLPIVPRK